MQNRKPYVRPMQRTWWSENNFFSWYMVRELTIVPLILFTLNLCAGLFALVSSSDAWNNWLYFSSHPVMLLINVLALIGALYHAKTFFSMMPQVMPIKLGEKVVPTGVIVTVQWLLLVLVSLVAIACI
ncbi:fumarate reductase subunit FrdC [Shewanella putrefaciens]|uniref:Fumarate reductase, subunit C n=1 Tax=Shewanella putrefaciens (strain CN-32 / ATCC BAA-453) TaxID=319224 RepID=A4Y2A1_SHEPC|nr:fumarate reductase subunit FrdC [Shewanella putrefaciens]MCA1898441.1 fumarate reductase subunit FrdC [Shewanella putrefaciens]QGS47653.1 fumarate reductase subunit FrdC [Shewanella putrefaciens]UXK08408.1 fumarate reductase subunit FrdC [Shewanella putrefaciens]CAD6367425.1 Fumarate reductase subunit C [Shewanella hafniensis]